MEKAKAIEDAYCIPPSLEKFRCADVNELTRAKLETGNRANGAKNLPTKTTKI